MDKKIMLIPTTDWKKLKHEINGCPKISGSSASQICRQKRCEKPTQCVKSLDVSRPSSRTIQDFIGRSKKFIEKEKILPINLKRAIFLSDVFTEKRHHLNFQRALQKLDREKVKNDNEKVIADQQKFREEQDKKRYEYMSHKIYLGKQTKQEIDQMKIFKKERQNEELNRERDKIAHISSEVRNSEANEKIKVAEKKSTNDKFHRSDILNKENHTKMSQAVDKEDFILANIQSNFLDETNQIINTVEKSIRVFKPRTKPVETEKEVVQKFYNLPLVKKSKLENKRELLTQRLKQERIKFHQHEMEEIQKRKLVTQKEKNSEYKLRCENLKVTRLFEQSRHRRLLEKIKEHRKFWNKQCEEKTLEIEKNRQLDKDRREKLVDKLQQEDQEYFNTASAILTKYQKQNKVTIPIIKSIRNGIC